MGQSTDTKTIPLTTITGTCPNCKKVVTSNIPANMAGKDWDIVCPVCEAIVPCDNQNKPSK